jgi:hypothetical protein
MKKSDRIKGSPSEKLLEITRERVRRQALEKFKHTKTCRLARELCLFVRTHRVAFEKKDVNECCSIISTLCKEAGCVEASELCAKAAEAVLESEEKYLELCEQSCKKCSESRLPQKRPPERAIYVA